MQESYIRVDPLGKSGNEVLITAVLPKGEVPREKLHWLKSDDFGHELDICPDPLLGGTSITYTACNRSDSALGTILEAFALSLLFAGIMKDPYVCPIVS